MAIAPKVLTRRFLRRGARLKRARASPVRNWSVSGLGRDGRALTIALEVLTRRLLRLRARLKRARADAFSKQPNAVSMRVDPIVKSVNILDYLPVPKIYFTCRGGGHQDVAPMTST